MMRDSRTAELRVRIMKERDFQMQRILWVFITTVLLTLSVPAVRAQNCLFPTKDDESLRMSLKNFHDVMAALIHGPAEKGDFSQVGGKADELAKLRTAIMSASLPPKLSARCADISAKASELSKAVDNLATQSKAKADNETMKAALEGVHVAYRNLNSSLTTLEDLLDAFHVVLHPLWHDAYPKKDTAAIKEATPKLKVRAKLIVATAEGGDKARFPGAQKLLESVTTLEEAVAAKDDLAILESLRIAHDAYEALAEGQH